MAITLQQHSRANKALMDLNWFVHI